jgi:glycosyltransferase involved in cell wall biosynthesis
MDSHRPIVVDARDAFLEPIRGWGRYVRELVAHMPLPVEALSSGGRGPEVLFEQVALPRILRRRRAALVHAPNCFLPLRRPCPGVVTIHDLAFEAYPEDFSRATGAKYRFVTPRAARSAERVITVSHATEDDVVTRYKIDPGKVRVVPNAPSLLMGDRPPPAGDPYLLAVGDLRPKKNLARLAEAWQRLGSGHRLVIAGLGSANGLPDGVEVAGYLPDAELDALMRGADLLVHPSLYEGFGLVVAEAMARGVPVAASAIPSLMETTAGAAEHFDPRDPDDIARAIEAALAGRAELAARGLARAAQLSWERSAAMTADVYRELLP